MARGSGESAASAGSNLMFGPRTVRAASPLERVQSLARERGRSDGGRWQASHSELRLDDERQEIALARAAGGKLALELFEEHSWEGERRERSEIRAEMLPSAAQLAGLARGETHTFPTADGGELEFHRPRYSDELWRMTLAGVSVSLTQADIELIDAWRALEEQR